MRKISKIITFSFFIILFLFSENVHSKEIYVVCDEPKGQRIDYENRGKNWKNINDGFSNIFPTFVYKSDNPDVINTHWPATNPMNLDPDELEKIVSGRSTEKILTINDGLIESLHSEGTNTWITRLYPKKGIGIFLRHGYYLDESLYFGAVYKSNCSFKTSDDEISLNEPSGEDFDYQVTNYNIINSSITTETFKIEKNGNFVCRLQNVMAIESENNLMASIDFIFSFDSTGKNNTANNLPRYLIALAGSLGNAVSQDSFVIKSGTMGIEINDSLYTFEKFQIEPADDQVLDTFMFNHGFFLAFDKSLKENVLLFGQALNMLLQISFGADVYLNFLVPDPLIEKRNILNKEYKYSRFKLDFSEDKKEEVLACLSEAYWKGFGFLTDINSNN